MLNHWITMGFKSPDDYQTRQGAMSLVGARDLLGELVLKNFCSISGTNWLEVRNIYITAYVRAT